MDKLIFNKSIFCSFAIHVEVSKKYTLITHQVDKYFLLCICTFIIIIDWELNWLLMRLIKFAATCPDAYRKCKQLNIVPHSEM